MWRSGPEHVSLRLSDSVVLGWIRGTRQISALVGRFTLTVGLPPERPSAADRPDGSRRWGFACFSFRVYPRPE